MSAVNPLSAEFLYELYATALRQEPLCAVLARHMRKEYLPDRSFQQVQEAIAVHFKTYKTPPSYAVLAQTFHEDYDAIELIDTFREYDEGQSAEVMTDMLESYIKGVRLQQFPEFILPWGRFELDAQVSGWFEPVDRHSIYII